MMADMVPGLQLLKTGSTTDLITCFQGLEQTDDKDITPKHHCEFSAQASQTTGFSAPPIVISLNFEFVIGVFYFDGTHQLKTTSLIISQAPRAPPVVS